MKQEELVAHYQFITMYLSYITEPLSNRETPSDLWLLIGQAGHNESR